MISRLFILLIVIFLSLSFDTQASNDLTALEETSSKSEQRHYGDFDCVPEELISQHILSNCDTSVITLNRSFFTLATGYRHEDIFCTGFDHLPTFSGSNLQTKKAVRFNIPDISPDMESIPSFTWFRLIKGAEYLPLEYWKYLKGSHIQKVMLFNPSCV
ncbi:MAG: hypothetical protein ACRYGR_04970 [Janthinobacterium lividum]